MPTRARPKEDDPDHPPAIRAAAFIGRGRELAALTEALAQPPAVVLIAGEAGVGKSRLVQELLAAPTTRQARSPGWRRHTLVASCPPYREPHTLGPVVDAVRRATDGVAALRLSALAGTLRPLFPEWAASLPPAPEPLHDARAARHRLFRALGELLDRLGVTVLVVEDVHWADDATVELLLFLAARQAAPSLLVTYRPEDMPADSLVLRLSSRRPAGTTQRRLTLAALDPAETARLVSSMLADEPVSDDFAAFLHRHTAGLPLAVEESVRLMYERADLSRRGDTWVRRKLDRIEVPPTVRDAVLERAARLDPEARVVLRAAAVLADPADVAALTQVSALASAAAATGVTGVLAAGLLHEDDRGLLAFRHALASRAVYETIPAPERRALHLRAAQLWEARSPLQVARLARHFREAGDSGNWRRYAEQAADLAVASGDEAAAATLLYDLLETAELPAESVSRLVDKVPYAPFAAAARFQVLADALRAALAAGSLTRGEQARARFQLGRVLHMMGETDAGRVELERAVVDLPPDSLETARAMVALGIPFDGAQPATVHREWLRRAADVFPAMDAADRLNLTVQRVTALLKLGDPAGWAEAAHIPDDAPDALLRQHITRGYLNLGDQAMRWGRYAEAQRRLTTAQQLASRHEMLGVRDAVVATRLHLDWFTGAWAGLAERVAVLVGADDITPLTRIEVDLVAALIGGVVDQAGVRASLPATMRDARRHGMTEMYAEGAAMLARLELRAGDVAGALRTTAEPMALVDRSGIWLWAVEVAPVRVDALVAAGRLDEAARLVRNFTDGLQGRDIPTGRAALGHCRAALAAGRGEHRRAAALFTRTAARWQALPRPYDALLAQAAAGRCLVAAGEREAGLAALAEALQGLSELGARSDADGVLRTLRELGSPVRRPGRGGRPSYGNHLSPRELDVVELLIDGRTNREIAEVLVLSVETVASHVRSAMRKLRVSSRTALAVTAVELKIVAGQQPRTDG